MDFFLTKCPKDVDKDTQVFTFVLISLRTRFSHEFGLDALDWFLITYQEDLHLRFKNKYVLGPENFILKSRTLTFDFQFYLQIKSTAVCVQSLHLSMRI